MLKEIWDLDIFKLKGGPLIKFPRFKLIYAQYNSILA